MLIALVIIGAVIACAGLAVAAARVATRNPALEAQARVLQAENDRLTALLAGIYKRARSGADVDPELQVVCDLIEGAGDRNIIGKGQ